MEGISWGICSSCWLNENTINNQPAERTPVFSGSRLVMQTQKQDKLSMRTDFRLDEWIYRYHNYLSCFSFSLLINLGYWLWAMRRPSLLSVLFYYYYMFYVCMEKCGFLSLLLDDHRTNTRVKIGELQWGIINLPKLHTQCQKHISIHRLH